LIGLCQQRRIGVPRHRELMRDATRLHQRHASAADLQGIKSKEIRQRAIKDRLLTPDNIPPEWRFKPIVKRVAIFWVSV